MKTSLITLLALLFLSGCDNSIRVSFESDTSSVLETDGSALISVSLNRSTQSGPSDINAPNSVSNQEIRVPYTVSGTAVFGTNHQLSSGFIIFPSKSKKVNLKVPVLHHTEFDGDRTVIITLGEPEGAQLGTITSHTLTVQEVDIAPLVNFDLSTQTVAESVGTIQIGVNLEYASQANADIELSFSGTAQMGTDFTANSSFTIPAGQVAANIPITLVDNLTVDGDKTLVVTMTHPNGALLGSNISFTLTIADDDNQPTVSFSASSQSVSESVGTVTATVTMNKTYSLNVTVPFTVTGTASQPADHNLANGSITILAGGLSGSTSFNVVNDSLDENNETVILTMGSITNGNPGANTTHTVTITDDDPTPTVQFSASTQNISEGVGTVTVRANLSSVSGRTVTVPFTVTGTATQPADHNLVTGSIVIAAGASFGTTSFSVVDDSLYEGNETVIVTMGVPTNATASGTTSQTITLNENDPMPEVTFSASSQSVNEGNSGSTTVTLTVNLSTASGINTSIPFSFSGSATNGSDFSASTSSPLLISAGSTSGNIVLSISGDTMYESDETVIVTLGSPTGATLGSPSSHTITLTNEDPLTTVYFNGSSSPANESAGIFVVNAIATNSNQSTITIPYTVTGTAANPSDHNLAAGNITIAPGNTIGTLSFSIVDDAIAEASETIIITMGAPTGATLGSPSQYTVTIVDNDSHFELKNTLLWLDAGYGVEENQNNRLSNWHPRYSQLDRNCGIESGLMKWVPYFWKDGGAVSFIKFPFFSSSSENEGIVYTVMKSVQHEKEDPPKLIGFPARSCRDLKSVEENEVAELLWVNEDSESLNAREIVNYLEKKYEVELEQ